MTRKAYNSGFKMKENPFKRNFGSFEEQKAKSEQAYSEGIRNIYHPEEKVTTTEPKKKKWYQRKPKGERNIKTWWNPFD